MPKILLLLPFLFFFGLSTKAQERVPYQFIVQFESEEDTRFVLSELAEISGQQSQLKLVEQLVPDMHLWLLEYAQQNLPEQLVLEKLQSSKGVVLAQYNHRISLRSTIPNDTQFGDQWQFLNTGQGGGTVGLDINADLAWDIATGGLSAGGDTIVVAVIDDGVNLSHPDLVNNIWVNHAEIPGNNFDDDGNGYVDDYHGWNSNTGDDNVGANGAGSHGTPVAGLIGAEGNNNQGVTGVNWKVKLMIIRNNFNGSEANVLVAYGYALTQRKRYNNSNGQSGAFVVATNASWGVDNAFPSSAPLWCAFYDTLGKYGILNVAATTNISSNNVDVVGDLPTSCPSDFLISVTNINRFGLRAGGYGANSIDLGAFGDGAYTLSNGGTYGSFGGTSGAAPQVTGAVALAYNAACGQFISLAKRYPNQAAMMVRQAILGSVTPINSLNGLTTTGGYLNLFGSLQQIQNVCPTDSCFAPFGLNLAAISDSSALIAWAGGSDTVCLRLRLQGSNTWIDSILTTQLSHLFDSLPSCKNLELEVSGWCNGALGSSQTIQFQTEGCCFPPNMLSLSQAGQNGGTVTWAAASAALSYQLRWRPYGTLAWNFVNVTNNSYTFNGLNTCSFYEVEVRSDCGDTLSAYSNSLLWATTGCGSCAGTVYCDMNGTNTTFDWIESVNFGGVNYRSGNNNGYHFYDSTYMVVNAADSMPLLMEQGNDFLESVRIWIDFNRDGDFADWEEKVFEQSFPFDDTLRSKVYIPYYVSPGMTRLRVALQWNNYPTLCTQYSNGETEDYCVFILPYTGTTAVESKDLQVQAYPNPTQDRLYLSGLPSSGGMLRFLDINGRLLWQGEFPAAPAQPFELTLDANWPPALYFLQIQSAMGNEVLKISKF